MLGSGGSPEEVFRPDSNPAIRIDFLGAKINSSPGFPLMRDITIVFRNFDLMNDSLEEFWSITHTNQPRAAA